VRAIGAHEFKRVRSARGDMREAWIDAYFDDPIKRPRAERRAMRDITPQTMPPRESAQDVTRRDVFTMNRC